MRRLFVIGIGAGDPRHLTLQAVDAMNLCETFFVIGKGAEKQELVDLRTGMLAAHMTHEYRVVEVADPPRDRRPDDYSSVVDDWHDRRAALLAERFAEVEGNAGILVWGDPALYDSTLRIVERIGGLDYEVIPGITSVQALAARHRIVLNRVGEPVHITTGRRLAVEDVTNSVVMLDGECSFTEVPGDVDIWWGAYVGMPDEVLISGKLREVENEIQSVRARLRAAKGWIMDVYLLRR